MIMDSTQWKVLIAAYDVCGERSQRSVAGQQSIDRKVRAMHYRPPTLASRNDIQDRSSDVVR